MSTYQVRLSNPTTSQTGSVSIKSWCEDAAVAEAKSRLESIGFTNVLSCEAVAA